MKLSIVLASILVLSFPSTSWIGREKIPVYDDSDGYQVMSLVLMNQAKTLRAKQIGIFSRTMAQTDCRNVPEEFKSAAEDLKSRSKAVVRLRRKFSLTIPYNLSDGGDFQVSQVGFDGPRTRAVVAAFHGCGALCGDGGVYLFRKVENRWQLVARACEIVS